MVQVYERINLDSLPGTKLYYLAYFDDCACAIANCQPRLACLVDKAKVRHVGVADFGWRLASMECC